MKDQGTIVLGALAGALAGSAFAYLYFTDSGRRVRRDLEPRIAELASELSRARTAATRARAAVDDSWDSVRHMDAHLRGPGSPGGR